MTVNPLTDDNKGGGVAVETFLHKIGALNALAAIVNQPSKKSDSIVRVPVTNLQLSMIKDGLLTYVPIYKKEEKEELKILCRPYLSEPQPSID